MLPNSRFLLLICLVALSARLAASRNKVKVPKVTTASSATTSFSTSGFSVSSSTTSSSGASSAASASSSSSSLGNRGGKPAGTAGARGFSISPDGTVSTSSATATSSGGNATSVSISEAQDGASVSTASEAVAVNGSSATAITVGKGKGKGVKIDEKTTVVATGKESKELVATVVKQVEELGKSKQLRQDVKEILLGTGPLLFSKTMGKGLRDPTIRSLFLTVGKRLLRSVGCKEFKSFFKGYTLPIARSKGAGDQINSCLFEACPAECCTSLDVKKCSCKDTSCKWTKPRYLQFPNTTDSFFYCAGCKNSYVACLCQ